MTVSDLVDAGLYPYPVTFTLDCADCSISFEPGDVYMLRPHDDLDDGGFSDVIEEQGLSGLFKISVNDALCVGCAAHSLLLGRS